MENGPNSLDCQPVGESTNNLLVVNKEQTANASTEKNNNTNNNDVDDWCEIEEGPSVKWTPLILQEPDMTEHGNNILSVALQL